jgi:DNA-binding NtrC family response regulator
MSGKAGSILVVDDEKSILFSLKAALQKEGYQVRTASDPQEALRLIEPGAFQVIISDYNMPVMNGLEFLKKVRQLDADTVFIMMTAYGSEKLAIEAMKEGAYDYFSKPFEIDEMRLVVAKALERFELAWQKRNLEERFLVEPPADKIIGCSEQTRLVKERIDQVGASEITVLIQGESGTGKELVAEAIQRKSPRAAGPFVKINCAAIPENLIESELFGYEKGAFTGAVARKRGKFEQAHNGTIFLDEIGDMTLPTQAKVLRAIQEKEIQRVGGLETIKVDVRIIAATHKNLRNLIAEGIFREDLFYRISVVNVPLAPLREREEDIPLLIDHFIGLAAQKVGRKLSGVSPQVLTAMKKFAWPGNVRQLQNILEGAAVFAKGDRIELENLPEEVRLGFEPAASGDGLSWVTARIDKGESLDDVIAFIEREMIKQALSETQGNQSQAASRLRIKRGTLQYKMKQYEIGT